ncbi:MAG TPA: pseudouridine synthase [Candidatus Hydrogenedentes bacterium]|nr:rRNA pseudouridine synthase [Candidatus Hydrogenedentota bacterium]NLT60410.1 rRNA pseudouridine synthase [Candidatus Hydrogenedentota bacterium]HNV21142.1 pseudouridine synthase [Candidatus Hydrogenedentota bacterium]HNZ20166.1 pseudouridine synthase [Candidatus Hydrogenedentota bacterium]HOH33640.1 pseudouridine synthase [Candidatus Hydrogenedentota bacterium]
MRLQRYLALCGIASRRASETLIREGRVTVNGAIAALGSSVDPDHDEVRVNGKPIRRERPVYILLHKPKGTITTVDDPQGRRTVLDCLQGVRARVYPVGRLDLDVSGVLLLTNDGELAQRLTHPRYGVTKVYIATVRGHVSDEALRRLETGVPLADGVSAPARAAILGRDKDTTRLRLTLHEGRKREVKRMCAEIGHDVVKLRRTLFAGIEAGSLRPGQWRWLRPAEVAHLRRLVKLS